MTATETISLVSVCGTIFLGSMAAALTAFKIYLDYRERSAHFRQALYAKQMEGYVEIFIALRDWHNYTQGYILQKGFVLQTDHDRKTLRSTTAEISNKLSDAQDKWRLFMPEDVEAALRHYRMVFNAISAFSTIASQYPPELVNSKDPQIDLSNAYVNVVGEIRKHIGTDPLTKQTLGIHAPPAKPA